LLGRIAALAPQEVEEGVAAPGAVEAHEENPAKSTGEKAAAKTPLTAKQAAANKSVRIALGRLDRMMNTVGELVISRTKMVGRVTELTKLIDTLSFSKERLQGKVSEFQEKYEFNRIRSQLNTPWANSQTQKMLTSAAAGEGSYLEEF